MWRDLADTIAEEENLHGPVASLSFFARACGDVLATGLRERCAMILRDIVFALRSLRKTPAFSIVVIATLAIAIGANAAVFSVLRAVVFAPLPFAAPQTLVAVFSTNGGPNDKLSWSLPDVLDLRTQSRVFTDVAAFRSRQATLIGLGKPQLLPGMDVTPSMFDVLKLQPELGRFFNASDTQAGGGSPIVISDRLWRTALGADTHAIGRSMTLDARSYRIIGVAPPGFLFPNPVAGSLVVRDYWTILRSNSQSDDRGSRDLSLIARMRPEISLAAAQADITRVTQMLAQRYPSDDTGRGARVASFFDALIGSVRPILVAAFGAVLGVVAIACANVANLFLSRSASRDREIAVRFAIGATRRRVISQILMETLLFAIVSGVLGIALASGLIHAFIAFHPPSIPRLDDIAIDGVAVAYTAALVGVCALACGLLPALTLSRPQLADALKAAGRGGDAGRGSRARNAFVVLEIAISVALVVSSGLIVRSFLALENTPLGITVENIRVASFPGLPPARYPSDAQVVRFYRESAERVRELPGVQSAAWAKGSVPLIGDRDALGVAIEGHPTSEANLPEINDNVVGPEYFSTLGISVQRGRLFTADDRQNSLRVAIVDEAFARTYFNDNAIGHWIDLGDGHITIVGVVANVRASFDGAYEPTLYLPAEQKPTAVGGVLFVRARPGSDLDAAIAAAVTASDPFLAPPRMRSFQSYADASLARTQLSAFLLGVLGLVALFLAIAGVYAVVSFGVAQRTQEFGIRMALGSPGSAIIANVVGRAARLALSGVLAGVMLAGFAAKIVQSELFGIGTLDPMTYAFVVVIVTASALLAALIPAIRATRVDPVIALRNL
jgi:putative ABC transport system permease protein